MVAGFTHKDTLISDEGATTLDQVTPMERQLFFAAAHAHFQNGCPLVAIEVMRKLPNEHMWVDENFGKMNYFANREKKTLAEINSSQATIRDAKLMSIDESWSMDKGLGQTNGPKATSSDKAADLFSSATPVSQSGQSAAAFDWSTPLSTVRFQRDEDNDSDLDLGLGDSDDEDEENGVKENGMRLGIEQELANKPQTSTPESRNETKDTIEKDGQKTTYVDVMAQQYKFIACLKVMFDSQTTVNLASSS